MNLDIPYLIFVLLIACFAIWAIEKYYFTSRNTLSYISELCVSIIPVLFLVLLIRLFVAQPFWIPSGSLKPTMIPGDFVLITEYDYGLHVPFSTKYFAKFSQPQTGNIVVFHWPVNPDITFIKRVVGTPGDVISYQNKILTINGKIQTQKVMETKTIRDDAGNPVEVNLINETLKGEVHQIYTRPSTPAKNFTGLVVPKGEYFMMGDNRDGSDDSRDWGFVKLGAIVGKAKLIFFSIQNWKPNWKRIGKTF